MLNCQQCVYSMLEFSVAFKFLFLISLGHMGRDTASKAQH